MPADLDLLLLTHATATLFMTGVIWFVQIVHYPLMAWVGKPEFATYEKLHTRWTTYVVAPPMLVEAATALFIAARPVGVPVWQAWAGLGLVMVIWLSTATLQVPQHRKLESGLDRRAHARLVSTNWVRTVTWTVRSLLVLSWLAQAGG